MKPGHLLGEAGPSNRGDAKRSESKPLLPVDVAQEMAPEVLCDLHSLCRLGRNVEVQILL